METAIGGLISSVRRLGQLAKKSCAFYPLGHCRTKFLQVGLLANEALPDYEYAPPKASQLRYCLKIPGLVPLKFLPPELRSGCRQFGQATSRVAMPEASIHKYCQPATGDHNIWCPWKILSMEPEAVSFRKKCLADEHFRSGVLALYTRHHPAAGFRRNHISQSGASMHLRCSPWGRLDR